MRFIELSPTSEAAVGGLHVLPFAVQHPSGAPSFALRVRTGNRIVVYSGDTGWTDSLVEVSRDADVFLCECWTFDEVRPTHISYRRLATERGGLSARRVVLVHLGPAMFAHLDEVEIEMAHDGLVIEL